MDGRTQKWLENWVITVESTEERHQTIILSPIAKCAHQSLRGAWVQAWLRA
jgi:hypothetical protein